MVVRYTFSELGKGNNLKTRQEAIKSCDEASEALGQLITTLAFVVSGSRFIQGVYWLLTRYKKRKLTKDYIEYSFPIINWMEKVSRTAYSKKITQAVADTGKGGEEDEE